MTVNEELSKNINSLVTHLFKFPLINYQDNNIDEEEFWEVIKKTKRIQLIGGETWLIKQYIQINLMLK